MHSFLILSPELPALLAEPPGLPDSTGPSVIQSVLLGRRPNNSMSTSRWPWFGISPQPDGTPEPLLSLMSGSRSSPWPPSGNFFTWPKSSPRLTSQASKTLEPKLTNLLTSLPSPLTQIYYSTTFSSIILVFQTPHPEMT